MWDFNFLLYNLTDMSWTLDWLFALFVIRLGLFLKPIWDLISISLELCMRFPFLGWSWIKILDFDCLFCSVSTLADFVLHTYLWNFADFLRYQHWYRIIPIPIMFGMVWTCFQKLPSRIIPYRFYYSGLTPGWPPSRVISYRAHPYKPSGKLYY